MNLSKVVEGYMSAQLDNYYSSICFLVPSFCIMGLDMSDFQDWITKKFLKWRGDTRRNVSDFAVYLNVSQPTVSAWINGTRGKPTSKKVVSSLVDHFGAEVYEVLGLPLPDLDIRAALLSAGFPIEYVDRFLAARLEYSAELASKGIDTDSPDARQIVKDAFTRHGIQLIDT